MSFPSRETVERLRKEYPAGTRVELLKMDDPQAPPIGTLGTVRGVDDIGSIMVSWDSGGSLSVAWGEDEVRRADEDRPVIRFDPTDLKAMRGLMRRHEELKNILAGENENGESVTISVEAERITTVTLQENGWVRRNIYHFDGTREELFDGRV